MKFKLLILIPFLLVCISVFAQPNILSFNPQSGGSGTSVTITGSGFNPVPANNIVYMGAAKATVTAASTTSLTITAPPTATYSPISVTTGGLTGFSQKPFIITFPSGPAFNSTSFAGKVDFSSGAYPRNVSIGDMDGDGKSDLASVNNNGSSVSIFRNISTVGNVAFTAPAFVPTPSTAFGEKLFDADGDGKLDLVVNSYGGSVSVYLNISTVGNITFSSPITLFTNQNPSWVDIGDINGDGKTDIVSFNQNSNTFSFFKNNSTPGTLSFDPKIDFPIGARPHGGVIADIDGDLKPDIAISDMDINMVSVFRNTSASGIVSFAPKIDYPTGNVPFNVTFGDLDGDDKKEMLVPNSSSATFSLFKNNSTPGVISFSPRIDFPTAFSPLLISVGDLNGDAKPDVAVADFSSSLVSVYKNLSTPGNPDLSVKEDYVTGTLCRSVPLGDIDGDGRPDIVSSNSIDNTISVLRNTTTPLLCPVSVTSFPYLESFELTNGAWTIGGTSADWTWGTPTKSVINTAGQGNKCWLTGGLTNSSYSNSQNSFLQSPCFNFSSLVHPRISFKVFWETEKTQDGATLEYSINGGTAWNTVGSINSNSNCLGENWYNTPGITSLNNNQGWSGNIQPTGGGCLTGGGSNAWTTASHDLTPLAGQPNVSFRFVFGSNNICNSFDGFAIDQVNIFETIPATADFIYTCKPALTADFTSLSICATGNSWNFGDLSSGAANTSTISNPSHTFSSPGTYTVTLTSNFSSSSPSTISKQITVLDVRTNIDLPVSCAGSQTATISAIATGGTLYYIYTWNTTPPQTSSVLSNVGAGTYSVTVTSGTACPATTTVIVTQPAPLQANPVIIPEGCTTNTGNIASNVSGGIPPYTYTWSNGTSTPDITGINAGSYSVVVSDSKNCVLNSNNIIVPKVQGPVSVQLGPDTVICPGQTLLLNPGNFSSYLWQDNSTSSTFAVNITGIYTVNVEDANGCQGRGRIMVTVDCRDIFFPTGFTPNGDTKNNVFGPAGNNLSTVKYYQLRVFNRNGELVFYSFNPFIKWDGKYRNLSSGNETLVWMASYTIAGKQYFKKGTVTIIK